MRQGTAVPICPTRSMLALWCAVSLLEPIVARRQYAITPSKGGWWEDGRAPCAVPLAVSCPTAPSLPFASPQDGSRSPQTHSPRHRTRSRARTAQS
eukprot:scaffold5116_cov130-Isochrysis_galbana.AAC.3